MKKREIPEIGPATAKFAFSERDPDSILKRLRGDDRLFAKAELAVARCDFESARVLYERLAKSPRYFISAVRFGVIAAIGLGDLKLFDRIVERLSRLRRTANDALTPLAVDLAEGWIHQWMWIPTGYPEWLCRFDFDEVPEEWRDAAAYLSTRICLVRGQFESAYATAALMMNYPVPCRKIAVRDIYLMMVRAVACRELGRAEEMVKWLRTVVRKVAPNELLLPLLMFMSGDAKSPVEEVLGEIRPDLVPRFRELDRAYYKNLLRVRNHYLGERVTDKLTFREMHLAMLLKRGAAYCELAARFGVTVGRMKNIVSNVYDKLGIHARNELKELVW